MQMPDVYGQMRRSGHTCPLFHMVTISCSCELSLSECALSPQFTSASHSPCHSTRRLGSDVPLALGCLGRSNSVSAFFPSYNNIIGFHLITKQCVVVLKQIQTFGHSQCEGSFSDRTHCCLKTASAPVVRCGGLNSPALCHLVSFSLLRDLSASWQWILFPAP